MRPTAGKMSHESQILHKEKGFPGSGWAGWSRSHALNADALLTTDKLSPARWIGKLASIDMIVPTNSMRDEDDLYPPR